MHRYERHIDVPEIGVEGQKKLLGSAVLVVGLGGLGCPAALYLAAGGVGRIGLADADTVSLSNLQRQILFAEEDVGQLKTKVAARELQKRASGCRIEEHAIFITPENSAQILSGYDLVLDCTDNFDTRYLLNAQCYAARKPLVSASVYHHDGQISVFRGYEPERPCYQCLYPKSEQLTLAPQCKESGIVGPVAGIFGCMQAAAAINEVVGAGETLAGWMLMFSSLTFSTQKVRLAKRADCEVCSSNMEKKGGILSGCSIPST